jgi:uncharacterized protein YehS (DUF1456 family)
MPIDGKKLLARLDEKVNRGRVNLYLDKEVYKRFKQACADRPISRVLEALMTEFIASVQPTKKK